MSHQLVSEESPFEPKWFNVGAQLFLGSPWSSVSSCFRNSEGAQEAAQRKLQELLERDIGLSEGLQAGSRQTRGDGVTRKTAEREEAADSPGNRDTDKEGNTQAG